MNSSSDVKVWSSLHRINHRFQVLHNPYPRKFCEALEANTESIVSY